MEIDERVKQAKKPEDLFGALDTPEGKAKRVWRQCKALHPDLGGDPDLFAKSMDYWTAWVEAKENNSPKAKPKNPSSVNELIATGSTSNLFVRDSRDLVYKVARNTSGNALLKRERELYSAINQDHGAAFFPKVVSVGKSGPLEVTVFERLDGFYTLAEVLKIKGHRLDGRDYAWMVRRVMAALTEVWFAGYAHCAVTADNVMIRPEDHSVVLVGGTFSTKLGKKISPQLKTVRYLEDNATSITDSIQLSDLSLEVLDESYISEGQRKFFQGNLKFPAEPATLLREYDGLLERLYGPRRFREFTLQ
jgi:hypothetical protein